LTFVRELRRKCGYQNRRHANHSDSLDHYHEMFGISEGANMSIRMSVTALSLDKMKAWFGNKDHKLLKQLTREMDDLVRRAR
jgi:hypothetical protein